MKTRITVNIIAFLLLTPFLACDNEIEKGVMKSDLSKDVEMVTSYGTIIMRLSDETPKHRNNFIRLVNQNFYDGLAFHRVIENFIIQTGDAETRQGNLQLPIDSASNILVESEFRSNLFHKRGALNAARMGDEVNPGRSSSGSQFTIVQGKTHNDSTLNITLNRVNNWLAKNKVINRPEHKDDFLLLKQLVMLMDDTTVYNSEKKEWIDVEKGTTYTAIKSRIDSIDFDSLVQAELATMNRYEYPETHREVYKTSGGAPHLDQNYTVFGEVIKGMDVVDSIAAVQTDARDKPIEEVKIVSVKMIERKSY